MEKLITISVPVYNAEKYLSKCIESIINQTYTNLEILLIDDGSSDNSYEICNEYSKRDSRILVIHKENGGLCSSRNVALDCMTGDYIMFVDCDDWIEYNMVAYLYENLLENDLDIISCGGFDHMESTGKVSVKQRKGTKIFNSEEALLDFYTNQNYTFDAIQCKLYKKECFENIRFVLGRTTDDTLTTPMIMHVCKKMGYFDIPLYNYLVREGSMTRTPYNQHSIDKVLAYLDNIDFISKNYPRVLPFIKVRLISAVVTNILKLELTNQCQLYESDMKQYKKLIDDYTPSKKYLSTILKINLVLLKSHSINKLFLFVFGKSIKKRLQI